MLSLGMEKGENTKLRNTSTSSASFRMNTAKLPQLSAFWASSAGAFVSKVFSFISRVPSRECADRERIFVMSNSISAAWDRSEEHTSELQSLMRYSYAAFYLIQQITP